MSRLKIEKEHDCFDRRLTAERKNRNDKVTQPLFVHDGASTTGAELASLVHDVKVMEIN